MFTLSSFCTENAAFDGEAGAEAAEVARILRDVAARIEAGDLSGDVRDINGNTVARFLLTPESSQ